MQFLLVLSAPDVYKSQNSDTYIVFGEAKMEDANQMNAAQQFAQGGGAGALSNFGGAGAGGDDDDDDDDIPELEEPEEEAPVDETGIDAKDIDLVMQQVNCTRAKAVKALKESGGDLINASTYPVPCGNIANATLCSHGRQRMIASHLCIFCLLSICTLYSCKFKSTLLLPRGNQSSIHLCHLRAST